MGSQAYYQNDADTNTMPASSTLPPSPSVPVHLRWLVAGAVISILLLIALPVVMLVGRDGTLESITRNTPDASRAMLDSLFVWSIVYTVVLHALCIGLTVWFVAKVLRGRRWARIALTVYLALACGFSLISAAMGVEYLWAVIPTDIIYVAMIVLLWVPKPIREFFAAHRAKTATSPRLPHDAPVVLRS